MRKLILALMALLVGCAVSSGVTKPETPLLAMGEARCIPGPEQVPDSEVCVQVLLVRDGCTVLQTMPATSRDKPVYVVGMLCHTK